MSSQPGSRRREPGSPGGKAYRPGSGARPARSTATLAANGTEARPARTFLGAERPALPGERRRPPLPRAARVAALPLAAGVAVALSLPPFGVWALAFPATAVIYLCLAGLRARARLAAGFLFGLGWLAPSLWWATGFNVGGYVAMTLAESAMVAVCLMAVPPARGRALCFPAAIVAFQAWIGSWPFGGVPLGNIALGQASAPLSPAARLGGTLLLTLLVCTGGVALGEAARCLAASGRAGISSGLRRRPRQADGSVGPASWAGPPSRSPRRRSGHALAALLAALFVTGCAVGGAFAPDGGPGIGQVRAALVQGGGQRGLRQSQVDPARVYGAQLDASAGLRAPLSLVVWPEDVIALDTPLAGSPEDAKLGGIARSLGSTVVAGVTIDVSSTRFRNEAVAWGPSGQVIDTYEKIHRVPFGEYVPLRGLFKHLADLSAVPRDAIPGEGPNLLRTPAGPLAVMVSYETFFPYLGRAGVRDGGQLLVVPTNTSSYATGQVPSQEIAASRLQAIDTGRDLLQAAPTGYSAFIDNHGRVLARSGLGGRSVILATAQRRDGETLYVALGDLPVLVAMACALAAGWALALWERRRAL